MKNNVLNEFQNWGDVYLIEFDIAVANFLAVLSNLAKKSSYQVLRNRRPESTVEEQRLQSVTNW